MVGFILWGPWISWQSIHGPTDTATPRAMVLVWIKHTHLGLAVVVPPRSSLARKQVKGELRVQDVKVDTCGENHKNTNTNNKPKPWNQIDTPEISLGKQIIFKNESGDFYAVSNVRTSETEIWFWFPQKSGVVPCLGEKRGDLQRCEVWSGSGLGATSWIGLTCTSANFLRHCSLFLIMDCTELSFSVTTEIWDWKGRRESKVSWCKFSIICELVSVTIPAAVGWAWLQTPGSECPGCFSERTAPSPGESSGTAAPPELPLWFGTCPPSDSPGGRRPRHTTEGPFLKNIIQIF